MSFNISEEVNIWRQGVESTFTKRIMITFPHGKNCNQNSKWANVKVSSFLHSSQNQSMAMARLPRELKVFERSRAFLHFCHFERKCTTKTGFKIQWKEMADILEVYRLVDHWSISVPFCIENAKFWPILTNLGYFIANLCTFRCTFYRTK